MHTILSCSAAVALRCLASSSHASCAAIASCMCIRRYVTYHNMAVHSLSFNTLACHGAVDANRETYPVFVDVLIPVRWVHILATLVSARCIHRCCSDHRDKNMEEKGQQRRNCDPFCAVYVESR
jgi:hypothetical protein